MAVVASIDGNNTPNGIMGLPTPVLLAIVGGGIGAVVFLSRRRASASNAQDATLLPNTAIMLGSLQQGVLDLKGEVGTDAANLSSQLTGTQENLSAAIDALTSQQQQALTGLESDLTGTINTGVGNLSGDLSKLLAGQDAIGALIGQSQSATQTYVKKLADSLTSGLTDIAAQHNAEMAAISDLVSTSAGAAQVSQAINSQLGQLISQVGSLQAGQGAFDWNLLNGKKIFSTVDQGWFTVQNGQVEGISYWDTTPGKQWDSRTQQINVNYSLSPLTGGRQFSGGG